jgi:cell division protein ZapA
MERILSDKVRVEILGREYEIDAAGLTPLEIHELAAFVDEKMREIRDRYSIADTQRIAVLAALNIAYETRQQRESGQSTGVEVKKRIERLNRLLDLELQKETPAS